MNRVVILVCTILLSCTTKIDKDHVSGDIDLKYETLFLKGAIEGEIAQLRLKITNNSSDQYVLLKSVIDVSKGQLFQNWQTTRTGEFKYNKEKDEYLLNRMERDKLTSQIFNHALLAPGDEKQFIFNLRLLKLPVILRLEYFTHSLHELADLVYFPFEGEDKQEIIYRKVNPERLKKYLISRRETVFAQAAQKDVVIYPLYPDSDYKRYLAIKAFEINPVIEKRKFGLSEAMQKTNITEFIDYTFCSSYEAWIVKTASEYNLVGEKTLQTLPEHEFRIWDIVDAATELEIEFKRETHELFKDRYKIGIYYNPERGDVPLLYLQKDKFLEFLRVINDYDLKLKSTDYGRLIVTR